MYLDKSESISFVVFGDTAAAAVAAIVSCAQMGAGALSALVRAASLPHVSFSS